MSVKIPLTQGKFALVDTDAANLACQYKWQALKKGRVWYARAHVRLGKDCYTKIYLHRLIANAPAGTIVDHINHDGLDNRRQNLRICTAAESARNVRKQERSTSLYKGVSFHKPSKLWRARISNNNGRVVSLGYFETEQDAAKAYDEAAKTIFKDYAVLNFGGSNGKQ